jgi:PST family polysaccharide transporter
MKIGIGLITSKILAIFVGPSGMALVGNFRNFTTSLETVSTLGFQTGIVKYVAESKENKEQLQKIFSTIFIFLLHFGTVKYSGLILSFPLFLKWQHWLCLGMLFLFF